MNENTLPFLILVSVFTVIHVFIVMRKIQFIKKAHVATGIVKNVSSGSLSNGNEGTYSQVIEFETEEGNSITITSLMGSSSDQNSIGKAVKVLYLPHDPKNAVIKDVKNLWGFEAIVFIIGMIALLVYFDEIK